MAMPDANMDENRRRPEIHPGLTDRMSDVYDESQHDAPLATTEKAECLSNVTNQTPNLSVPERSASARATAISGFLSDAPHVQAKISESANLDTHTTHPITLTALYSGSAPAYTSCSPYTPGSSSHGNSQSPGSQISPGFMIDSYMGNAAHPNAAIVASPYAGSAAASLNAGSAAASPNAGSVNSASSLVDPLLPYRTSHCARVVGNGSVEGLESADREKLRLAFLSADRNQLGFVDFSGFFEALRAASIIEPYFDALNVFSKLDEDKDGCITEAEFVSNNTRRLLDELSTNRGGSGGVPPSL